MNHRSWVFIIGVLCVGAVAAYLHRTDHAQAQLPPAKGPGRAWEYKVFDTTDLARKEKELNDLGADGWEVVTAVPAVNQPSLTIRSEKNGFGPAKDHLSAVSGTTANTREAGYLLLRRAK